LPVVDPEERNVHDQRGDPNSVLEHYRQLISERRELGPGFRLLDPEPDVLAYARNGRTIAVEAP
jgi:glycosidase